MIPELKPLEWDTNFFGQKVFRVDVTESQFDVSSLQLPPKSLIYVYSSQLLNTQHLLVDKKITFANAISKIQTPEATSDVVVNAYADSDISTLTQLSIRASGHSRFRVDPLIPTAKADELYRLWLERALKNPKDFVIQVARSRGQVAGMNVLRRSSTYLTIDLISVFDEFQGQGIGKHLIKAAAAEAASSGISELEVTTQLDNRPACKLYEKMGLVKKSLSYIYHIHT